MTEAPAAPCSWHGITSSPRSSCEEWQILAVQIRECSLKQSPLAGLARE
ncbi:hypothetical protein RIEGSTA812A_PEG_422 [invertebrate metagenome]|uniref:Uncharacterized protein n=1 Tax=invertebrate metagenome TaxID=1711999 RepID=A0A484H534_9ZZZZ